MKRFTVPALTLGLFLTVAVAFAGSAIVSYPFFPADPPGADWVTFDNPEEGYPRLPAEGMGDILDGGSTLNIIISGDAAGPEYYVSGDRMVKRIGYNGAILFFRMTAETTTMPVNYVNNTPETYDLSTRSFAGGAALSGSIPPGEGQTSLTITAPHIGSFPMVLTPEDSGITTENSESYEYPHGIINIVRLSPTPLLRVTYNSLGENLPFGSPSGNYPLIKKDLMPYRFLAGTGNLTVDLGTVFVTQSHSWPGSSGLPAFPYSDVTDNSDQTQKGKSLMVRVANWGSDTLSLELSPARTGFESFYIFHNRLSCNDSAWPNWPWLRVIEGGGYPPNTYTNGNFEAIWTEYTPEEMTLPETEFAWPLLPAMTAMYWGGVLDPVLKGIETTVDYQWPFNRTYASGSLNTWSAEIGTQTVTVNWTPKMYDTLGMIYPYTSGQEQTLQYNRWNPCRFYPESPDVYQGSGLVVQMVDFDLEDLAAWKPGTEWIDVGNSSVDWNVGESSIAIGGLVPIKESLAPSGVEGPAALPLLVFSYTTDALLADLYPSIWAEIKDSVNEGTPLDSAFLARTRITFGETDLVALAGEDRTNFFRVMGDTGRVATRFFAVVVDGPAPSGEQAVQKKDGYFLLYDGATDQTFDTSMAVSLKESGCVCPSLNGSGGCSTAGVAPFAFLLLIPMVLARRR